jgi:hypothetical protein
MAKTKVRKGMRALRSPRPSSPGASANGSIPRVAAHGVMIVTPVNWYQASSGPECIIDRSVCAESAARDSTQVTMRVRT